MGSYHEFLLIKNYIMKIALTVKERLILQGILPAQGGLMTIGLTQEIRDAIRITSKEADKLKMKETEFGITWDNQKEGKPLEIDLTQEQVKILKDSADRMDKEEKITIANYEFIKRLSLLEYPEKES